MPNLLHLVRVWSSAPRPRCRRVIHAAPVALTVVPAASLVPVHMGLAHLALTRGAAAMAVLFGGFVGGGQGCAQRVDARRARARGVACGDTRTGSAGREGEVSGEGGEGRNRGAGDVGFVRPHGVGHGEALVGGGRNCW